MKKQEIIGVCVNNRTQRETGSTGSYSTDFITIEYLVDSVIYRKEIEVKSIHYATKGEKCKVLVDIDNPYEIELMDTEYSNERRKTNKKVAIIILSIFIGAFFISYLWNFFDLYRYFYSI